MPNKLSSYIFYFKLNNSMEPNKTDKDNNIFQEKDKSKTLDFDTILSYILVFLFSFGLLGIPLYCFWKQEWQIYSWQIPLFIFVFFICLLIMSVGILVYCGKHQCKFGEKFHSIFGLIFGVSCLIAFLIVPFKGVYYCEVNVCNAKEFAIINTNANWDRQLVADNRCKKIGMNREPGLVLIKTPPLYALSKIFYERDKNNLEKLNNSNGSPIKLYSYSFLGLFCMLILAITGFFTIFFGLFSEKPKKIYILLFVSLLFAILLRIVYIVII